MLSLAGQLTLVGRVALAGVVLAMMWDVYRSLKALLGFRRPSVVFVTDLLLFSLLGPVAFWLLLLADGAQMRLFTLVGLVLGIAAYRLTLSSLVVYLVWASGVAVVSLGRSVMGTWWWIIRRSRPWGMP